MTPVLRRRAVVGCGLSVFLLVAGFALAWLDFGWFRAEIELYRASVADQVLASAAGDSIAAFGSAGILLAGAGSALTTTIAERRRSTDPLGRHPVVLVVADTLLIIGILLALAELFVAIRMISPGWSVP